MAPGIFGDLFVEFSWGAVLGAFLFGWMYGVVWRWMLVYGGRWLLVYLVLMTFSVFAVVQVIASAFLFRFLITAVPTFLLWGWWVPDRARRPMPASSQARS